MLWLDSSFIYDVTSLVAPYEERVLSTGDNSIIELCVDVWSQPRVIPCRLYLHL